MSFSNRVSNLFNLFNSPPGQISERSREVSEAAGSQMTSEEVFSKRSKTTPELAWEYEYIDNELISIRLEMAQIHEWQMPENGDERAAFLLQEALKNPRFSAAYNHRYVAGWALDQGNIIGAQRAIFSAKRELPAIKYELAGSEEEKEAILNSEATQLLIRARNELTGPEKDIVLDIVTNGEDHVKDDLTLTGILEAAELIDANTLNRNETYSTLERQFRVFLRAAIAGISLISAFYVLTPYLVPLLKSGYERIFLNIFPGYTPYVQFWEIFGPLAVEYGISIYIAVILFGLLGASISGLFTLRDVSPEQSNPSRTVALKRLAQARLTLGVIGALMLFLIFESGVLGSIIVIPFDATNPMVVLIIAFLGGFSERLLVNALGMSIKEENLKDMNYMK